MHSSTCRIQIYSQKVLQDASLKLSSTQHLARGGMPCCTVLENAIPDNLTAMSVPLYHRKKHHIPCRGFNCWGRNITTLSCTTNQTPRGIDIPLMMCIKYIKRFSHGLHHCWSPFFKQYKELLVENKRCMPENQHNYSN